MCANYLIDTTFSIATNKLNNKPRDTYYEKKERKKEKEEEAKDRKTKKKPLLLAGVARTLLRRKSFI